MKKRITAALLCLVVAILSSGNQARSAPPERFEFTRMVAHWAGYSDPTYLSFIKEARPEVAQLGFYGATYYGLVHTPQYKDYPAHFPVQGLSECRQWFVEKNRLVQKQDVKIVGHFNVEFLFGDPDGPEGPRGFFKFYRDLWDENKLGPKPVADPMKLLEIGPDGKPIGQSTYKIGGMGEYWACLRNPDWQKVLKAWVRSAVNDGVDGLIANYFYRHNCLCEHCQKDFRAYMQSRFTAEQLSEQFDIKDLAKHPFKEIVYWHKPEESTLLRREMLRFSQISNKQVFDEVFLKYGRSLKPDLIVAQWNHLGGFSQINGDERCMMPAELWGKDETYLWYSTGSSAFYTDLENRNLGEGTLQARYIRGAFDDKPYTLGKYESTRTRAAIAELAANGGAPMGFYTRFTNPQARKEIVRYYGFMRKYDALFHANRSHAEAVLLFPRSSVHQGNLEPVATFRKLGTKLLDDHVLFDVLPDDLATEERLAKYKHVIRTSEPEKVSTLSGAKLSQFDAPYTVRVSASRPAQGDELTVHLVNYNRIEPPKGRNGAPSAGGGIQDEKPVTAPFVKADLVVPVGYRVKAIEAITPERADPRTIPYQESDGRVQFSMPSFLVYQIARIHLEPQK